MSRLLVGSSNTKRSGVLFGDHQTTEHEPHSLAAAQRTTELVPRRVWKEGPGEPDFEFVVGQMMRVASFGHLRHRQGVVERSIFLIEKDDRAIGSFHAPCGRDQFTEQQPHECRFAAAVIARYADSLTAADF